MSTVPAPASRESFSNTVPSGMQTLSTAFPSYESERRLFSEILSTPFLQLTVSFPILLSTRNSPPVTILSSAAPILMSSDFTSSPISNVFISPIPLLPPSSESTPAIESTTEAIIVTLSSTASAIAQYLITLCPVVILYPHRRKYRWR